MEDINGYQPDEEPPLSSVLPPGGGSTKDTGERGRQNGDNGEATTYCIIAKIRCIGEV